MNNLYQRKKALRKKIKTRIASLSETNRFRQAVAVFGKLEQMPVYREAQSIMLFWSFGQEIFTHDFVKKSYMSKQVLLPVIDGNELLIKFFEGVENMKPEPHYGILEPQGKAISNAQPDIIVLPGLAFDANCNRLGRGKAFYDKLLNSGNINAALVGVGFNEQIVDAVPFDSHDYRLDMVITPESTYHKD
ncbi:MAG TPA: 5-formyltetrahydrofolate cyclo-ligase [Salinivirga sp.]|uniref:5-formyltetrahydrofolate cyclo-ligase n=1 Tax=Salinivirga sp. TaxID=1970192 RepID=UPI002B4634D7|nr:5-formyltetrahydrofolate cyclo-ligase [Salinivirga sp.]HKK60743.1 5-formyltetrahydrofolate cyclo-ligase [Salinivirga sp.]